MRLEIVRNNFYKTRAILVKFGTRLHE